MFGNREDAPEQPPPAEEEFRMPPLATITVKLDDHAEETWEGHQIEQTTFGALNIHRFYQISAVQVLQKMVVSYAPGSWKKVVQTLDVASYVPSAIIH